MLQNMKSSVESPDLQVSRTLDVSTPGTRSYGAISPAPSSPDTLTAGSSSSPQSPFIQDRSQPTPPGVAKSEPFRTPDSGHECTISYDINDDLASTEDKPNDCMSSETGAKIVEEVDVEEQQRRMYARFQSWALSNYGESGKTKTITRAKYNRVVRLLQGEELATTDNSKLRFWVKAKGFCLGKAPKKGTESSDPELEDVLYIPAKKCADVEDEERAGGQSDSGNGASSGESSATKIFKRVAKVEDFFDIIYNVHVEMDGRGGKHAGQKRTYRASWCGKGNSFHEIIGIEISVTNAHSNGWIVFHEEKVQSKQSSHLIGEILIAQTYAFLPREAVTKFLMSCSDCQKRMHLTMDTALLDKPERSGLNHMGVDDSTGSLKTDLDGDEVMPIPDFNLPITVSYLNFLKQKKSRLKNPAAGGSRGRRKTKIPRETNDNQLQNSASSRFYGNMTPSLKQNDIMLAMNGMTSQSQNNMTSSLFYENLDPIYSFNNKGLGLYPSPKLDSCSSLNVALGNGGKADDYCKQYGENLREIFDEISSLRNGFLDKRYENENELSAPLDLSSNDHQSAHKRTSSESNDYVVICDEAEENFDVEKKKSRSSFSSDINQNINEKKIDLSNGNSVNVEDFESPDKYEGNEKKFKFNNQSRMEIKPTLWSITEGLLRQGNTKYNSAHSKFQNTRAKESDKCETTSSVIEYKSRSNLRPLSTTRINPLIPTQNPLTNHLPCSQANSCSQTPERDQKGQIYGQIPPQTDPAVDFMNYANFYKNFGSLRDCNEINNAAFAYGLESQCSRNGLPFFSYFPLNYNICSSGLADSIKRNAEDFADPTSCSGVPPPFPEGSIPSLLTAPGGGQPFLAGNLGLLAIKQVITGYRDSAAFLRRSADELELLLNQKS